MTKDSVSQSQWFFKLPGRAMTELYNDQSKAGGDLFRLMMYIVKKARVSPGVVQIEHGGGATSHRVLPGQSVVGSVQGGIDIGCSKSTFHRRLQTLVEMGFVTVEPKNHCSIVTLSFAPAELDETTKVGRLKTSKTRGSSHETTPKWEASGKQAGSRREAGGNKEDDRWKMEDKSKPVKYPNEEEIQIFAEGLDQTSYPNAPDQVQAFFDHYEANGWIQGKGSGRPIKNWQAAFRAWVRRSKQFAANGKPANGKPASEATSYQDRMEEARRQQGIENVRRLAEHAKLAKEAKQKRREASRAS